MKNLINRTTVVISTVALMARTLLAQEATIDEQKAAAAELAQKLQNPIANLISVPIQNDWDFGIGSVNAMRYTAKVQPVIPFALSEDLNLITRTVVPVIYQESPGGYLVAPNGFRGVPD